MEKNQKKFESEEEVTKRYLNAVSEFIETAKKDVNVIAVVVAGSLANDVVWEKSDIDAFVVVRDQKITVPEFCLDADGIVLNMNVQERNSFVRMLEGRGFANTFMSKAQVMYTTDESITKMVEQNKTVGANDAQKSAMMSACDAVCFIEKAEKWLYVKKDYTYCRYYIIKMAEAFANLEIWMAGEAPGREALQRAQRLNPALIEKFYYFPMKGELSTVELEELLKAADDYLMGNIEYISAPVLEYLEDGEIKTLTMFYRHFHVGGHFLVHLLVYLSQKGIIDQVSETVRITPKSRPSFEEIAFMSVKNTQI
ncbi:MAG: nucleotidyltransferase domain-containing protein [Oscillospiraceae bacterium]|nr:nucleotidyltransferase domain-containing protein [Oscillospiraceae bacterium]